MVYFIIWEVHVFSHQFPIVWKNTVKPIEWEKSWKLVPILVPQSECFFPVCSYPVVYFIICKIHGLSHQFPIAWGKAAKLIEWEKPGK